MNASTSNCPRFSGYRLHFTRSGFRSLKAPLVYTLSAALTFNPLLLAAAPQIVTDGRTDTRLQINGNLTDVRTNTIRGDKAFNSFDRFDVHRGNTVNLHLPGNTDHLLNLVHGKRSDIHGILNSYKNGGIGGNVYFANPFGVVIGQSGQVNVGSLHLSTPSRDFMDRLFEGGDIRDQAVSQLMEGQVPVSRDGLISVQGVINALEGVTIRGFDVSAAGLIRSGALLESGAVDIADVVNTAGAEQGAGARVVGGVIEIFASNDLDVAGTLSSDAREDKAAGRIDLRAGRDITVEDGARVSARGSGDNSDGGDIIAIAERDGHFRNGAVMDVSAGESGDGGFIEFSADRIVNLDGGRFLGRAANGEAGRVYIDPETVNANVLGGGGVDYEIEADTINVAEDVVISTRDVAVDATSDENVRVAAHQNDDSVGDSSDITLRAATINLGAGSQLLAWANEGYASGDILLTNLNDDLSRNVVSDVIGSLLDVYGVGAAEESKFLARVTNADSEVHFDLDGATLKGGDVTLEAYASDRLGFDKNASASIRVNDTRIEGNTVVLDARSDTSLLPELDDDSGSLPQPETFADLQWGFDGSAFYSRTEATSDITISGDSVLLATENLDLLAESSSRANPLSLSGGVVPVGGEWSDSTSNASITVVDNAELVATGELDLLARAINNTSADVNSVISSNSIPFNITFSVAQSETNANVDIGEGTELTGASASIAATAESKVLSSATSEKRSGSSAGAALGYSDVDTNAGVVIAGTVTSTLGDVNIDASIDSNHSTASSASSLGGSLRGFAKFNNYASQVQQNMLASLLKPVTGSGQSIASLFFPVYQTGKFNLSGAVSIAQEDNRADIRVQDQGRIDSAGKAALNTLIENDTFIGADTNSTSAGVAIGGAVAWSDYDNRASSLVEAGGSVMAADDVEIMAESLIPDPRDAIVLDPSRPNDTLETLTTGLSDLLLNSGVFNSSKGSQLGLAAGANLFHANNQAVAGVEGTAEGRNVDVAARSAADIINAGGVLPKISASKNALGGNVNMVTIDGSANAYVADGARIRATEALSVDADAELDALEITFAGGRAEQVGVEGAVSIFDAGLTSSAYVGDQVDLVSGSANVTADNRFDVLNTGGAFVLSKQGGIGASVALNTIESNAHAYLGNAEFNAHVDPDRPELVINDLLEVTATSDGEIESYSFAGVVATGSGSGGSSGGSSGNEGGSGGSSGGSTTGGKKMGIGVAGQASVNRIDGDTLAEINGARIRAGGVQLSADSSGLDIAALSGAVAAAGGQQGAAGIAGGYSQNQIQGDTRAALNAARIDADQLVVDARGGGTIQALSAAVGAAISSKGFGLAASVTNNSISDRNTRAVIAGDSVIIVDDTEVTASNDGTIQSLAGSVAGGGKAAVGGSVAVNRISGNTVEASIGGENTDWQGDNMMIDAASLAVIETAAVGAAFGGQVGISGSVAVNRLDNDVLAEIRDGARVNAANNVGVLAESDDRISVLAGGVAIGASAGVGASAVVNEIYGTTGANITGANTEVTARAANSGESFEVRSGRLEDEDGNTLGAVNQDANVDIGSYQALDIPSLKQDKTVTGLAVNASSSQHVETLVANVAGGKVGVGVLATVNVIDGETQASIQDSVINDIGAGGAAQDVDVSASNHAYGNGFAGVFAAGKGGVGAASDNHLISRATRAYMADADVSATGNVGVDAYATQGASSLAVGGAAGLVGVAGTGTVLRFDAETDAYIARSSVATNDLSVTAQALNALALTSGAVAGGGVGVAATFSLGMSENVTRAYIEGSEDEKADLTQVSGNTRVSADSQTTANSIVVGGAAAGAQAIAGMASVNLMSNQTSARVSQTNLGADTSPTGNLSISANDGFAVDNKAGALTIGGTEGIGAGAIVNIIKGGAQATLSESFVYSGGDVTVAANSIREIDNRAAAFSAGGNAGISALAVITLLGDSLNDDAASEVDNGGSGTLSSLDSMASGNKLEGTSVEEGLESDDELAQVENRSSTSVADSAYSDNLFSTAARISGTSEINAGDVNVTAIDRTSVSTEADAAGIGGTVGLGGAVGLSFIKTQVETEIGRDTVLRADGNVSVKALAGQVSPDRKAADIRLFAGGGGLVGLGAAVGIADVDNRVTTTVDGQLLGNGSNTVTLSATDETSVEVDGDGAAIGAFAVGLVYAKAEKGESDPAGNTLVRTRVGGDALISDFAGIDLASASSGRVESRARSAAGGIISGNGSLAEADDDSRVLTQVADGAVLIADQRDGNDDRVGGRISMTADVTPDTDAVAEGAGLAATYRAGVSLAYANVNASAETDLSADRVDTYDLDLTARHNLASDGTSVTSRAFGAGGGLLLGLSATESESVNNVTVRSGIGNGAVVDVLDTANILAWGRSNQTSEAIGINAGLIAVGANVAETRVDTLYETVLGDNLLLTGGILNLDAEGRDDTHADALAGSGGVVSGVASTSTTINNSTTRVQIGAAGVLDNLDVDALNVTADHTARFNATTNSTNASLLGASGAWAENRVNSNVEILVDDGASLLADAMDFSGINRVVKPESAGFNVESGSGGVLDAAAARSNSYITNRTLIDIGDSASLTVADDTGHVRLGILNDIFARDRVKLDSGGAISVARAESSVENDTNEGRIQIGNNAEVTSEGDIDMAIRNLTDIRTSANAKTYGGAGAAQGQSRSESTVSNVIALANGARMVSAEDVRMMTGRDANGNRSDFNLVARTDLWNKTVLPIETKPNADAALRQNVSLVLDEGASIETVGDVSLSADRGTRTVSGSGVGKDLYREALAAVGSFFSNLVGGDDVSLEIKGGSISDTSQATAIVNGEIHVGTERNRILVINEDGTVNQEQSSEGFDDTLLSVSDEPLVNELEARKAELEALIAELEETENGTPSSGTPELIEELSNLEQELSSRRARETALAGDIAEMDGLIGDRNRVAQLQAQIDGLDPDDHASQIAEIQGQINSLQQSIDSDLADINGNLPDGGAPLTESDLDSVRADLDTTLAETEARIVYIDDRIATLEGQIIVPDTDTSDLGNALRRYRGELLSVQVKLESLEGAGDPRVMTVAQALTARSSSIYVDADTLAGNGVLDAPGDTRIEIRNRSNNFLRTNEMTIPDEAGGFIVLNGARVNSVAEVNSRNRKILGIPVGGEAGFSQFINAGNTTPTISVTNAYAPQGSERAPDIFVDSDISNINGLVEINNIYGSVLVRGASGDDNGADISAETLRIEAGRDISLGYRDGFRHIEGEPASRWRGLIDSREAIGSDYSTNSIYPNAPGAPAQLAANNVFLAAEYLNLNGIVQSGIADRGVTINDAMVQNVALDNDGDGNTDFTSLADYRSAWEAGNADRFIQINELAVENDRSQIPVLYDAQTNELVVDNTRIMGGKVELFGHIMNTSHGEINVMDGYGRIEVDNTTDFNIRLRSLDAGRDVDGQVRITDYFIDQSDPRGRLEADARVSLIRGSDHPDRTAYYDPQQNQYYSFTVRDGASWTDNRRLTRERWFGINAGEESSYSGVTRVNQQAREPVGADVVLLANKGGARYWYDNTTTRSTGDWYETTNGWQDIDNYALYIKDYKDFARSVVERQVHNHNIAADNRIDINFTGFDQGLIDVNSVGAVSVEGNLSNEAGLTGLASDDVIRTLDNGGQVGGRDIRLTAGNGIGSADQALVTNLGSGVLNADGGAGGVYLRENSGDLVIDQVTSNGGQVSLTADGNLLASDVGSLVTARGVDLRSENGRIGSPDQFVRMDTSGLSGTGLVASAAGEIHVVETDGDMLIRDVASQSGLVSLGALNGDLIDDNPVEQQDQRARDELLDLWDSMNLTGEDALDAARDHVAAIERRKAREYERYWQFRSQQPGGADAFDPDYEFTLDAQSRDYLASERGLSTQQISDYEQAQTAEYRTLHDLYGGETAAFEPGRSFDIAEGSEEWNRLTEGYAWNESQLLNSLSTGILAEVSDTEVTIEAPNVSGQNIRLEALAGNIGTNTRNNPTTINIEGRNWQDMSDDEKLLLATAERGDIEFVSDQEIRVVRYDDLDLAADGEVQALAGGSVYLGSEGDLLIDRIEAGDQVRIKSGQGLSGVDHGLDHVVAGGSLLLEAGTQGIGVAGGPGGDLLGPLNVVTSDLTARAGDSIWLNAAGDLPVSTLYAVNDIRLSAGGSLYDALDNAALNIRAANLDLQAGDIGEFADALDVALDPEGTLIARSDNAIYLDSPDRGLNVASVDAGGNVRMFAGGDLTLDSASGGIRSQAGDVDLSAAEDLRYAGDDDQGVVILARNLFLESLSGNVGSTAQWLQVAMAEDGNLDGTAAQDFYVHQTAGDLAVGDISANEIGLSASADLVDGNGDGTNLTAERVELRAASGGIAGPDALELASASGTAVTAAARDDIHLSQQSGDLIVDDVNSQTGDVSLSSLGDLTGPGTVTGNNLTLDAIGSIGNMGEWLKVEARAGNGGTLNGAAGESAWITSDETLHVSDFAAASEAGLATRNELLVDNLAVGERATLAGDQVRARVEHSGQNPLQLDVTGYAAGVASVAELVVGGSLPLAMGRLYAVNSMVRHGGNNLSISDGYIRERMQIDTPALRLVMDNKDQSLEEADVQLYSGTGYFNLAMTADSVTTNQYAVDFRPGLRVDNRAGLGESLLTQAADEAARLSDIVDPPIGGAVDSLVGPGAGSLLSYYFDQPFVNGVTMSATAAGPLENHCEQHPYARECNAPRDTIHFPIR